MKLSGGGSESGAAAVARTHMTEEATKSEYLETTGVTMWRIEIRRCVNKEACSGCAYMMMKKKSILRFMSGTFCGGRGGEGGRISKRKEDDGLQLPHSAESTNDRHCTVMP